MTRAFKEVFLNPNNSNLLKALLEFIFKIKIDKLEIKKTELLSGNVNIKDKRVDVSIYLGTYTKTEDGTLNFSFNKIIWNSGEVTALTPVKNISLKENNKEYTYELKNSLTSSSDIVLLSKTTSSEVKKDLDNAYQTLNNN